MLPHINPGPIHGNDDQASDAVIADRAVDIIPVEPPVIADSIRSTANEATSIFHPMLYLPFKIAIIAS